MLAANVADESMYWVTATQGRFSTTFNSGFLPRGGDGLKLLLPKFHVSKASRDWRNEREKDRRSLRLSDGTRCQRKGLLMKLVLVVEDEYASAEVVQLLLESEGYRVAVASSGKDAWELLEEERPALVLSDFMMPTMDGGELGRALRRDAALSHIPFVFMSGTSEAVVRSSFRDYDAFLPKPFAVDALLLLVARLTNSDPRSPPCDREMSDSF